MPAQTKPSVVFAHGLWADGSCFSKLIPALQAEGHRVIRPSTAQALPFWYRLAPWLRTRPDFKVYFQKGNVGNRLSACANRGHGCLTRLPCANIACSARPRDIAADTIDSRHG